MNVVITPRFTVVAWRCTACVSKAYAPAGEDVFDRIPVNFVQVLELTMKIIASNLVLV